MNTNKPGQQNHPLHVIGMHVIGMHVIGMHVIGMVDPSKTNQGNKTNP
jgi:hypothetical protein